MKFSDIASGKAVSHSKELQRIAALPSRPLTEAPPELVQEMTSLLRTPAGSETLRPIQAQALYEIGTEGGGFLPMQVGTGKTLVSLLAPRVLDASRPVLILPAALVEKTERERKALAKDWRVAKDMRLQSYQFLGRVSGSNWLQFTRPDVIILDECHLVKNARAAVTRRLKRYMKEHPDTKVVAMSGTVMKDSLRDFAHIVQWTHKAQKAPVPAEEHTVIEWAEALDEKVNILSRRAPGALLAFAKGLEGDDLSRARQGFHKRFTSTPGIVPSLGGSDYAGSLYIEPLEYTPSPATEAHFRNLRTDCIATDGWALTEAMEVWRAAREIALGLCYVWDPRPPPEWLFARKAWAQFVRETLKHSRVLDSELQVANAVIAGDLSDDDALANWRAIKPTFTVNSRPAWHDDAALNACAEWLERTKGLCWIEHTFFAEELSRRTGVPFFGAKGLDKRDHFIEDHKGPAIASMAANCTGRNLQYQWSQNLITSPPDPLRLEQVLGRTHRKGQPADNVEVEVLFGCFEHWDALNKARSNAATQRDMFGQDQKILLADLAWPDRVDNRPGFRWAKNVLKSPA